MRIVLHKISDERHVLEIVRDARVERMACETRSYLTHDLLHYAVEREAGVHVGFWGSLAAGRTLAELNDRTQPISGADEVMQIERVVGALSGAVKGRSADALVEGLRANADAFPLPVWLTVDFVIAVQERMRQLLGRWHATAFGTAMELTWPM